MKAFLILFLFIQISAAHLLRSPLSTITLKFENKEQIVVSIEDEKLSSLIYSFGGFKVELPPDELKGFSKVDIASISLSSTDLERVKTRFVEFDFVSPTLGDSNAKLYFRGQEYMGRFVIGPPNQDVGGDDPFGGGTRETFRKLVGEAEELVTTE